MLVWFTAVQILPYRHAETYPGIYRFSVRSSGLCRGVGGTPDDGRLSQKRNVVFRKYELFLWLLRSRIATTNRRTSCQNPHSPFRSPHSRSSPPSAPILASIGHNTPSSTKSSSPATPGTRRSRTSPRWSGFRHQGDSTTPSAPPMAMTCASPTSPAISSRTKSTPGTPQASRSSG